LLRRKKNITDENEKNKLKQIETCWKFLVRCCLIQYSGIVIVSKDENHDGNENEKEK
jgi:hypothetical protein